MNLNNTSAIGRYIDRIDSLLWRATEEDLALRMPLPGAPEGDKDDA